MQNVLKPLLNPQRLLRGCAILFNVLVSGLDFCTNGRNMKKNDYRITRNYNTGPMQIIISPHGGNLCHVGGISVRIVTAIGEMFGPRGLKSSEGGGLCQVGRPPHFTHVQCRITIMWGP